MSKSWELSLSFLALQLQEIHISLSATKEVLWLSFLAFNCWLIGPQPFAIFFKSSIASRNIILLVPISQYFANTWYIVPLVHFFSQYHLILSLVKVWKLYHFLVPGSIRAPHNTSDGVLIVTLPVGASAAKSHSRICSLRPPLSQVLFLEVKFWDGDWGVGNILGECSWNKLLWGKWRK